MATIDDVDAYLRNVIFPIVADNNDELHVSSLGLKPINILMGLANLARLGSAGESVMGPPPYENWLGAPATGESIFGLLYELRQGQGQGDGDLTPVLTLLGTPNDPRTTDPPTIFSLLYCLLGVDPPLFEVP